jgi:hypothetical protein
MNYYNYFTEIEDHFAKRRGKHLLLSPMDWGLIASWRDSGVPLQVALRGIDIAMDGFQARKHRDSSKVNSLCYCHDSVMAEYGSYLESHVGQPPADLQAPPGSLETGADRADEPGKREVLDLISARISEINTLCAKHSLCGSTREGVERVRARLEEIMRNLELGTRVDMESLERDLGMADELLVSELRGIVSPEEAIEWDKEAKRELKVYRKRLPVETYQKILDNFLRGKIHKKFNVGELSIFHL